MVVVVIVVVDNVVVVVVVVVEVAFLDVLFISYSLGCFQVSAQFLFFKMQFYF